MQKIKQTIFGKKYLLYVAKKKSEKKKGMNLFLKSPKGCGMLFPYSKEEPERSFTLSQTPFPLHVIFLDKYHNIVHQEIGKAFQKKPIVCPKYSKFVIEIPV